MLISKKHKFIFIHVYKTAGMSISAALKPYTTNHSLQKAISLYQRVFGHTFSPEKNKTLDTHVSARELAQKMGYQTFSSYFTFGFVRNPWDWQVSLYEFARQNPNHHQYEFTNNFQDFDAYIHWRCSNKVRLQKDWFYTDDDQILVDFIGKFENLESDFSHICERIGLQVILPHKNKSKRGDYREYYSHESKRLIEEHYKADIKHFEYTFDMQ